MSTGPVGDFRTRRETIGERVMHRELGWTTRQQASELDFVAFHDAKLRGEARQRVISRQEPVPAVPRDFSQRGFVLGMFLGRLIDRGQRVADYPGLLPLLREAGWHDDESNMVF